MKMNDMRSTKESVQGLKDLCDTIKKEFGTNLTMIEIGSYAGESTKIFAESSIFNEIHAIDPWGLPTGHKKWDKRWKEFEISQAEWEFDKIVKKYPIIKKYKMTSKEFYHEVDKVEEIDFVYIDGNHDYESVKEDLRMFINIADLAIGGHDYTDITNSSGIEFGVIKAVDECLGKPDYIFWDSSWLYKFKE